MLWHSCRKYSPSKKLDNFFRNSFLPRVSLLSYLQLWVGNMNTVMHKLNEFIREIQARSVSAPWGKSDTSIFPHITPLNDCWISCTCRVKPKWSVSFQTENSEVIFLQGIFPPPTSQLENVMTLLREAKANPQCCCGQKINITIRTNYTDSIHRFVLAVENVLLTEMSFHLGFHLNLMTTALTFGGICFKGYAKHIYFYFISSFLFFLTSCNSM